MIGQFLSAPAFSPGMLALVFVEGLAAFLSPCVLPMIPVYLLYLGGGGQNSRRQTLLNTAGFVLGFTLLFMALSAVATALGRLLNTHQVLLTRLGGLALILMGLHALGAFSFGQRLFLKQNRSRSRPSLAQALASKSLTPLRAVAFGAALAVTWMPCAGVYLGAALTMAGGTASLPAGMLMLLFFSLGLGIPFLLLALLYHRLSGALTWLKRRQRTIQWISGAMLIAFGVLMAAGAFGYWSRLFA
ncbi:MAG: cytochrome c biogenesis CcdA family protein [Clostridia bacterium]|nr:cytochrome c biogenesis CcdA family protein [Clostridia bacterium]